MKKSWKKENKKGSLTKEFVFIIAALVAGTILLCYFLNVTFIEKYYLKNKQDTLLDGFSIIDETAKENMLTSHMFDITFDN